MDKLMEDAEERGSGGNQIPEGTFAEAWDNFGCALAQVGRSIVSLLRLDRLAGRLGRMVSRRGRGL